MDTCNTKKPFSEWAVTTYKLESVSKLLADTDTLLQAANKRLSKLVKGNS